MKRFNFINIVKSAVQQVTTGITKFVKAINIIPKVKTPSVDIKNVVDEVREVIPETYKTETINKEYFPNGENIVISNFVSEFERLIDYTSDLMQKADSTGKGNANIIINSLSKIKNEYDEYQLEQLSHRLEQNADFIYDNIKRAVVYRNPTVRTASLYDVLGIINDRPLSIEEAISLENGSFEQADDIDF